MMDAPRNQEEAELRYEQAKEVQFDIVWKDLTLKMGEQPSEIEAIRRGFAYLTAKVVELQVNNDIMRAQIDFLRGNNDPQP